MTKFHSVKMCALAVLAMIGTATVSANTIFSDSTFSPVNYTTGFTFLSNPASSATYVQCASCGNPGFGLLLTISEPNSFPTPGNGVIIGIVNTTFAYNPATQGAITSIAASADRDFSVNVAITFNNTFRPLIEQSGLFYAAGISGPILAGPGTTGYNSFSGLLTAADFLQIDPATGVIGSAHPNFAGAPILLGVAQLLGTTTLDNTIAVIAFDNLNFALTTAAVPEPASLALLGIGLAGLGAMRRRRQ